MGTPFRNGAKSTVRQFKFLSSYSFLYSSLAGHMYIGGIVHFQGFFRQSIHCPSNDAQHAIDLLDKKRITFTAIDRPLMMAGKLVGWDKLPYSFLPFGDTWKEHRRLFCPVHGPLDLKIDAILGRGFRGRCMIFCTAFLMDPAESGISHTRRCVYIA